MKTPSLSVEVKQEASKVVSFVNLRQLELSSSVNLDETDLSFSVEEDVEMAEVEVEAKTKPPPASPRAETFTHADWARTCYPLGKPGHLSRMHMFLGMFLNNRFDSLKYTSRVAMILVAPPGTASTMEDIAQYSVRYELQKSEDKDAEVPWCIVRRGPLSATEHPGVLLFLFNLGATRAGIDEEYIWMTLTREMVPQDIVPGHEDVMIMETDWVWCAVKLLMDRDLVVPPDRIQSFDEWGVQLPDGEWELGEDLPLPMRDVTGNYVARKLGTGRFKWGAH